jgi:two-component system LytT family response regulator
MKKLKAIIVDDERLARKELASMLMEFPKISVVAEADGVKPAIEMIKEFNPDVLFLDIQMPGKSGFDLVNAIDVKAKIIFVTAYDEYAIRAFEINALDYLLKPINPERLRKAIDRLDRKENHEYSYSQMLEYHDFLLLNLNGNVKFIRIENITLISSSGDYTNIFCSTGEKGLVLKTMKEWENRLPAKHFCRVHRSTILNIEKIIKMEPWSNNSFYISLEGIKEPVVMSRRYFTKLKEQLG